VLRRRRSDKAPKRPRRRIRKLRLSLLLCVLGLCGTAAFAFGFVTAIASDIPSIDPANSESHVEKNGYIYAADGQTLAVLRGDEARIILGPDDIAPIMKQAIVAVEDRRFYEHRGVDLRGIFRAVWADVRNKEVVQGGSTITQQLVKNVYTGGARSFRRKFMEAALAYQLEQEWPKRRILTAYLNMVCFGHHAYGVEAAAEIYFGTHARSLQPWQAALLAGLVKGPSEYDPVAHPYRARARRNLVLRLRLMAGAPAQDGVKPEQHDARHHGGNQDGDELRVRHFQEPKHARNLAPRGIGVQKLPFQ